MASARTWSSPDAAESALTRQWRLLAAAVDGLPGESFGAATRLPGWSVAVLVAHLIRDLEATAGRLVAAPPAPAGQPLVTVADYYRAARTSSAAITERATALADEPSADLRARLMSGVRELTGALTSGTAAADPPVETRLGPMLRSDFISTRLVEAVVHGLDLPEPVRPDPVALRLVVRVLGRAVAATAPGRSVELRVPPHVAVQCVAGPKHTRGTPPNVVEVDPLAFVELATGRLTWQDALTSGRLRASGERADLQPWLPLV